MAVDRDDGETPRPAAADRDEPGRVGLVVDRSVFVVFGPEPVQPDAAGAMVVVDPDIEERGTVRGPDHAAVRPCHMIGRIVPGRYVADLDGVEFRAFVVGRPGEEIVSTGGFAIAEFEELMALGQRIAVEQDGLGSAAPRDAAEQLVLTVFPEARVVFERTIGYGDIGVLVFHAAAHLLHKPLLKRRRRGHDGFRIGVLALEQIADLARQRRGIAQHLAPVFGTDPGEIVEDFRAMDGAARATSRDLRGRADLQRPRRSDVGHAIGSTLLGLEIEGGAVHAIAKARRTRPIREHVAKMRLAGGAADFGTPHQQGPVGIFRDGVGFDRRRETRPAGARVELGRRSEERSAATDARVGPR